MKIQSVKSDLIPPAHKISQAIQVGGQIWTAQVPKDPVTGAIVEGDIEVQTARMLDNLAMTLAGAGGTLANVVQVTIFIVDEADAPGMNRVWDRYFAPPYPNRATVVVNKLLARGARIEITAQAYVPVSGEPST